MADAPPPLPSAAQVQQWLEDDRKRYELDRQLDILEDLSGWRGTNFRSYVHCRPPGSPPLPAPVPKATAPDTMHCPLCGSGMRRRKNKTTEQEFWGCRRFPGCKGTAPCSS